MLRPRQQEMEWTDLWTRVAIWMTSILDLAASSYMDISLRLLCHQRQGDGRVQCASANQCHPHIRCQLAHGPL
jgi:hypothetical protein